MEKAQLPLSLFEGFGIELEYMIVDQESLMVRPIADQLIHDETGAYHDEVDRQPIGWSNELVAHVIELKTNGPSKALAGLEADFGQEVRYVNERLERHGARLMPTGMHPFMNPAKEMKLWPHGYNEVYRQFDAIFNCKGHGWSNLQSCHINLPFQGDAEFGALHAAIRLLLPLLPALAASSPMVEGKMTGAVDSRVQVYRQNAIRVPSVSGLCVPENAFTRKDYEMNILARIYQDLAPFDPDNVLQHEWVNARGAIARFDRSAIEIRLLDAQECPLADIAIAQLVVMVLKALMGQRWVDLEAQKRTATRPLADLLRRVVVEGGQAPIEGEDYRRAFGLSGSKAVTAQELWQHLLETVWPERGNESSPLRAAAHRIVTQGNLSHRMSRLLGPDGGSGKAQQAFVAKAKELYGQLCDCLAENRQLVL
jgi:hypothetical protein